MFKNIARMMLIAWSIGLGGRFVVEYLKGSSAYNFIWIPDFWLDWMGLLILGVVNLIVFTLDFHRERGKANA